MAAHDAGVQVECPSCGQVVLQKAMIPVLGEGGAGIRYLCPACARALIVPPSVPGGDGSPEESSAAGTNSIAAGDDVAGDDVAGDDVAAAAATVD